MDCYYRRGRGIASRVVDNEAMLVKLMGNRNKLFVLNRSASRIWINADGTHNGAELSDGLEKKSVKSFLDVMVSHGLLERTDTPAQSADIFPQDVTGLSKADGKAPKILSSEPIEVLASTCESGSQGAPDCRVSGPCNNPWD